ncbi:MAG: cell division protein MraZ [Leifsonia xyli]|nr:MAG: cell division protein MraZ [Leifsonia xyli]
MGGTEQVVVGNKGRLVIPATIRARHAWNEGTTLLTIDTEDGVILMERTRALRLVREQLAGSNLVAELLDERRREALGDDD